MATKKKSSTKSRTHTIVHPKKHNTTKDDDDNSGLFIPAGLFLGMGAGFLTGHLVAGIFLGLGAGFLGFAIVKNKH